MYVQKMSLKTMVKCCTGFTKVGGYSGLLTSFMTAISNSTDLHGNSTCGIPSNDSFTMLRGPTDKGYPWPGFIFGQTCASVWYWAADQVCTHSNGKRYLFSIWSYQNRRYRINIRPFSSPPHLGVVPAHGLFSVLYFYSQIM